MILSAIHLPLAAMMLAPAFLWAGAALAAIPILIHILNRRRYKVVPWAAMEYLLQAMRKNRRRLQFEQWLLLATRCLLLALLGFALARPVGCSDHSLAGLLAQPTGLHVLLIDNACSMSYQADRTNAKTHLDQAKLLAHQLIDRLTPGGESVAIITASNPSTPIIAKPTYDLDAARRAIDRIEQSYTSTDLVTALQKAIEIGREQSRQPQKNLYIFTDGTHAAWPVSKSEAIASAGRELAKLFRLTHFNLAKPGQWNQAILDVSASANLVTNKFSNDFIALAKGFGTGPDPFLQWKLDDRILPGGGNIRLDLDTPPQTQSQASLKVGGPHVIIVSLIGNDRLPIDNIRSRVIDVTSEMRILLVEGNRGTGLMSGSAAFLDLALAPPKDAGTNNTGGRTDSYIQPEVISDLELGSKVLSDYRAVILTNVGQITPMQADQLQKFVQQGGALLIFMGEQVNSENYNQTLLPRKLLPGPLTRRMSVASDQKGFLFDFKPQGNLHPLLGIFRGEEKSGLDTAQTFTYWQLDLPADSSAQHVLDYLPPDDSPHRPAKDPAITLHSLGQGRVLFIATSADAEWTSFPAKPSYVTLMHELMAGTVDPGDGWMNLQVGQSLQIPPAIKLTAAPILLDPQHRQVILDTLTAPDGTSHYLSCPLAHPGIYLLTTGTRAIPISVNVPADAADIRTIDNQAIKHALGDVDITLEQDQLPLESTAQQTGNDYGWSFMLVVLGLVGAECFMAMRFGHYKRK